MTIDWWTLALQTINVLVLVWLLGRFLYRPLVAIVERRRTEADRLLADAAAARDEAAALRQEVERARAGLAAEREALLADGRAAAEAERKAILEQASAEVASHRKEAQHALEHERQEAEQALAEQSVGLAVTIARRLLEQLPARTVLDAFMGRLATALRTLPDRERAGFTAGSTAELVTASPLAEDDRERCRALITDALGSGPTIAFAVDPALIAGMELRAPHTVVRNSWQADLERIIEELTRAEHHPGHARGLA